MNKYRIKIIGKNPRFFLKKLILNKIDLYDIIKYSLFKRVFYYIFIL